MLGNLLQAPFRFFLSTCLKILGLDTRHRTLNPQALLWTMHVVVLIRTGMSEPNWGYVGFRVQFFAAYKGCSDE